MHPFHVVPFFMLHILKSPCIDRHHAESKTFHCNSQSEVSREQVIEDKIEEQVRWRVWDNRIGRVVFEDELTKHGIVGHGGQVKHVSVYEKHTLTSHDTVGKEVEAT